LSEEIPLLLRDRYTVASWDTDPRGCLAPSALGRYLQESAVRHAERLGFGMEALRQEGLTWVVGALLVRFTRYPRFHDEVVLETWPRGAQGRRALRDFRLLDAEGNELAAVSGTYSIIDLETRHPVTLERFHGRTWREVPALDRSPHRLPPLVGTAEATEIPLRWSDLDLLGHVTNTRYLDLALECYRAPFLREHELAELELNFLAEGGYPDVVASRRGPFAGPAPAVDHALTARSSGRDLCRARLTWRPA
jgi:acyl-ACP thioesterase